MKLLHDLIAASAERLPDQTALYAGSATASYAELAQLVGNVANGLRALGVARKDRVAIFLPKTVENVAAMFGASAAGAVFVPVNPVLKAPQVAHILRDSGARVLITSTSRVEGLVEVLGSCPELRDVVLTDDPCEVVTISAGWANLILTGEAYPYPAVT